MWDAEESARRGFACPREWKQRLTSREYERLRAVSRKWCTGYERRDIGLVKAAVLIAGAMAGRVEQRSIRNLFPNVPPEGEQTADELIAAMDGMDGMQCQPDQSEP